MVKALFGVSPEAAHKQRNNAYQGAELITGTHRLNTMNLLLHGIDKPIDCIDALTSEAERFVKADLILTNPPFNKFPERVSRSDFVTAAGAAKGPLPFVEHVVRGLKVGGRAAIVVPDNTLFEDNMGRELRNWVMDLCDLHTVLRLPTGIFYAQGVKTSVIFLTKRSEDRVGATKAIWFYDLRAQMPSFGKTRNLTTADFEPFIAAYGNDPHGKPMAVPLSEAEARSFPLHEGETRLLPAGVIWLAVGVDVSGRAAYSMQCAKDESRALAHEAARALALSRLRASLNMPGFPAWQKAQADA